MDDDFAGWRKSSYSFSNGNCAEVARWRASSRSSVNGQCAEAGTCRHGVAVRDSKDPGGPVLTFAGSTWGRFLAEVRGAAVPA
jgi:hypothetical protein